MTKMRSKHLVHGLAVLGAIALGALSVSPLGAQQASKLRIIQTNYGGDTIHIIDPATNKVVREIKGVEAIHGVVAAPDGNRIYFSEESTNTVVVMDGKTMQITKRIPLSGNPNLIDITPDGKTIYAAISLTYDDVSEFPLVKAGATGGVDVIDTVSLANIKTIAMKGGVHDLNVTPDGKFVIVGNARGGRANVMTVVDTKTNDVAWTMPMDPSPSPMAVSKKADGSTDKIYAQNGRDNGFQVIDFATRKITQTVTLPDISGQEKNPFGPPAVSHGLMVTPDQKTLVIISRGNSALYTYSLPDVKYIGVATLGGKGAGWLVLTPDNKRAYVANEHSNTVSAVDLATLKELAVIPVSFVPSRNATWIMP
jgi:YVTN family beta-propeller protein